MDKASTDNVNNTETKPSVSKPVETVEDKKKPKRKFEWTPKRKAAFEKCVAARKNKIQTKPKIQKRINLLLRIQILVQVVQKNIENQNVEAWKNSFTS